MVTDVESATTSTYKIETLRRFTGFSFSAVTYTHKDSTGSVTFRLPANGDTDTLTSSAPLAGSFTMTCTDPADLSTHTTRSLAWNTDPNWVAYYMMEDMPFLAGSVRGYKGHKAWGYSYYTPDYYENNRKF